MKDVEQFERELTREEQEEESFNLLFVDLEE